MIPIALSFIPFWVTTLKGACIAFSRGPVACHARSTRTWWIEKAENLPGSRPTAGRGVGASRFEQTAVTHNSRDKKKGIGENYKLKNKVEQTDNKMTNF